MKKLAYILSILLLMISCKEQAMKSENIFDVSEEALMEGDVAKTSAINSIEALSIQKLNEYFDLMKLKAEHPEFEEDIISQLENYAPELLIEHESNSDFKIESIQQIGEVQSISDSISRILLRFDVVSGNGRLKDSVFANITSKVIVLEGEELKSNKVTFSKR